MEIRLFPFALCQNSLSFHYLTTLQFTVRKIRATKWRTFQVLQSVVVFHGLLIVNLWAPLNDLKNSFSEESILFSLTCTELWNSSAS